MYQIDNIKLRLKGEIEGLAPVLANGTINGFLFYFRAKYNEWSFAISEHPEIDRVDIQYPEQGKLYGFFAKGEFGGVFESKASYMDNDNAVKIIENCVMGYLSYKDKG
jgi:hypothetical protein